MSQRNLGGRPTDYTPELGEQICLAIATNSKGLKQLCKENKGWPARANIFVWLRKHPEFRDCYAQAREFQTHSLVDDIIEIADNDSNDTVTNKNGIESCNSEWVQRSKLRVDSRKWIASKLMPKVYGDKITDGAVGENLIAKIIDKL